MRVCVAGSVVRDRITTPSGHTFSSLGGILYNVYALRFVRGDVVLYPVFFASGKDIEYVKGIFSDLPVDWRFVMESEETDLNEIVYRDRENRVENYVKKSPFLSREHLPDGMDGYLINFIHKGDFKDGLNGLSGCVYVDLHKRSFYLREEDKANLIEKAEFIQCNRDEFAALMEFLGDSPPTRLVVTGGSKGAWLFEHGRSFFMPARDVEVLDPTGAGDVFGTAFLLTYLSTGDSVEALSRAVHTASLSVTKRGLS